MQGVWVPSLVGQLRSYMPHDPKKQKYETEGIWFNKFNKDWKNSQLSKKEKEKGGRENFTLQPFHGFPYNSTVKNLPAVQEMRVGFLSGEDPLEKEMATHSSILAWRIPWTEKPGGLQCMELQIVGHDWATKQQEQHICKPAAIVYKCIILSSGKFPSTIIPKMIPFDQVSTRLSGRCLPCGISAVEHPQTHKYSLLGRQSIPKLLYP